MVIEPECVSEIVLPNDIFLLCSDGLHDMVEDQQIQTVLSDIGTVQEKTDKLYELAMRSGGKDRLFR